MIEPASVFQFEITQDAPSSAALGATVLAASPPPRFVATWLVPEDLPYFEGHFPQQAVLPAIAILDASLEVLRKGLQDPGLELAAVPMAKFAALISPGMSIIIEATAVSSTKPSREWQIRWSDSSNVNLVTFRLLLL